MLATLGSLIFHSRRALRQYESAEMFHFRTLKIKEHVKFDSNPSCAGHSINYELENFKALKILPPFH